MQMSAIDELLKYLFKFTPEQLDKFLINRITQSILQPEEATESYLQEEPLCDQ